MTTTKTPSSSLLDRLKKAGTVDDSEVLSQSSFFYEKDVIPTDIPIINIALSGDLNQGLTSGLTILAGPSRHFKSILGLLFVKAYFNNFKDAVCLFYDSEFGITPDYISANGIDPSRVIHIPVEHLEHLKFDISARLAEIKRGDKVIIFIDSLGNMASKKEAEDALSEKSVADMTRAKVIRSLWRIVTPHLPIKNIPCVVINHVYDSIGSFYPTQIMSGGQSPMLAANTVFFIGKSQDKDGTELLGYNFTLNVEKSRFVREKSKFPFTVSYEHGIQKYSGLMDLAIEAGVVVKPNQGFYQKVNLLTGEPEGKKYRLKDTHNEEFWASILESVQFNQFLTNRFKVGSRALIQNNISTIDEHTNDDEEDN